MGATINWENFAYLWTFDPGKPLLFSTLPFLVWFMLFYGGYLLLLRQFYWRLAYTLVFSWFFYYKSSGWYLLLIMTTTLLDFGLAHLIHLAQRKGWRLLLLWISLALNLGILGYFKYANFFMSSAAYWLEQPLPLLKLILPAGISFFTFQSMSYSIDVYRRQIEPLSARVHNWRSLGAALLEYAFFVSFFPQLVAGPIVRASEFLPQIKRELNLSNPLMGRALLLMMSGLIKKTVISDYISTNFVDRVFENPALFSGLENLLGAYGYAIQIYCDFSGYSDMAIGLALLLGFRLPDNFHTPYRAATLQEFWRRWHISLSSWLRDYLYVSLGGNRHGQLRTYANLLITMLLGGLWHGASWVFLLWGGLHGLGLAIDRLLSSAGRRWGRPVVRSYLLLLMIQLVLQTLWWQQQEVGTIAFVAYQSMTLANILVGSVALMLLLSALVLEISTGSTWWSRTVSIGFTFHFVTFGWIFFRAGALNNPHPPLETIDALMVQLTTAFHPELWSQLWASYPQVLGLIALGFVLHYLPDAWYNTFDGWYLRSPVLLQSLVLAGAIWLVIQMASSKVVPFIYFQF